jgi:hypothetical protein
MTYTAATVNDASPDAALRRIGCREDFDDPQEPVTGSHRHIMLIGLLGLLADRA